MSENDLGRNKYCRVPALIFEVSKSGVGGLSYLVVLAELKCFLLVRLQYTGGSRWMCNLLSASQNPTADARNIRNKNSEHE